MKKTNFGEFIRGYRRANKILLKQMADAFIEHLPFPYLCVPAFLLPQEHSSSGFQASYPIPSKLLEKQ